MKAVILGCGRVGAMLGLELGETHDVTIVDWNPSAFERLGDRFQGETVVGNGIDVDVLKRAGVKGADLFLALTDGDNRNLMAAEVAHELGAKTIIARVYDAERSRSFDNRGFMTISPTITSAERLFRMVVGAGEER